jgi:ribosomal protein L32
LDKKGKEIAMLFQPDGQSGSGAPGYVQRLEMNIAKSLLICEALWELLREKTNLTEEDLYKKLYEIDMRDGALDGQNQPKMRECPNCHRPVSGRHAACLYCGHVLDGSVFRLE